MERSPEIKSQLVGEAGSDSDLQVSVHALPHSRPDSAAELVDGTWELGGGWEAFWLGAGYVGEVPGSGP